MVIHFVCELFTSNYIISILKHFVQIDGKFYDRISRAECCTIIHSRLVLYTLYIDINATVVHLYTLRERSTNINTNKVYIIFGYIIAVGIYIYLYCPRQNSTAAIRANKTIIIYKE